MRIAFLVNDFPTTSETFISNLVNGLLDAGHELDIYCLLERRKVTLTTSLDQRNLRIMRFEAPSGAVARIIRLPLHLLLTAFAVGPRGISVLFRAFRSNMRLGINLVYAIPAFSKRVQSYDVIHAQFGGLGLLGLYLREFGLIEGKLVTSFRGADLTRHVRKFGVELYHPLFKYGDMFLPVSTEFSRRLVTYGCPPEKIRVFRSGIQVDKFNYSKRTAVQTMPVRILSIGRLVEKKGIEYVLRGIALLRKMEPTIEVEYHIIGRGPLRESLNKLVHALGLESIVVFRGVVPHDDVVLEFERTDIFLLPSVTGKDGDEEGIPNALKEAMASGVPVIATSHSGIPELVEHGKSGLLVPERDPIAIAEAICSLINNPPLVGLITQEARRIVEREYDINDLLKQLQSYYSVVLS